MKSKKLFIITILFITSICLSAQDYKYFSIDSLTDTFVLSKKGEKVDFKNKKMGMYNIINPEELKEIIFANGKEYLNPKAEIGVKFYFDKNAEILQIKYFVMQDKLNRISEKKLLNFHNKIRKIDLSKYIIIEKPEEFELGGLLIPLKKLN